MEWIQQENVDRRAVAKDLLADLCGQVGSAGLSAVEFKKTDAGVLAVVFVPAAKFDRSELNSVLSQLVNDAVNGLPKLEALQSQETVQELLDKKAVTQDVESFIGNGS